MLVYIAIDSVIQIGHNFNFKHGGIPGVWNQDYPLLNMCDPAKSIAGRMFKLLCGMLNRRSKGWACMNHVYGDQWRRAVRNLAVKGTISALGHLWRRFIRFFKQWPWPLLLLARPGMSRVDCEGIVNRFLAAPLATLETFGKRMRQEFQTLPDYFDVPAQSLLKMAARALICTDHVENEFAHLKQWLLKSMKPPRVSYASAHNTLREWKRLWKDRLAKVRERENWMRRPAWVYRARTRITCWNIHVADTSSSRKMDANVAKEAHLSFATQDRDDNVYVVVWSM
jgi:hypothetical protein